MSNFFQKAIQPKAVLALAIVFAVYAAIRIATVGSFVNNDRLSAEFCVELISLFAQLGHLGALLVILRAVRDQRYFESFFVVLFVIPSIGTSQTAAIDGVMKFQRPEFSEFSLMEIPMMHGYAIGLYMLFAAAAFVGAYMLVSRRSRATN